MRRLIVPWIVTVVLSLFTGWFSGRVSPPPPEEVKSVKKNDHDFLEEVYEVNVRHSGIIERARIDPVHGEGSNGWGEKHERLKQARRRELLVIYEKYDRKVPPNLEVP